MKVLFCAYDRPGHVASGPNAWIQRLIPDLRGKYNLDVNPLFIYGGKREECPTIRYFDEQNLFIHEINRDEWPYIKDQVRLILKIIKKYGYTILVANLVIPAFYAAKYLKPFNIPVIGVLHSSDQFYRDVIDKFITGKSRMQISSVVCVSQYIADLIHDSGNTIKKHIIPCGTPQSGIKAKRPHGKLQIIYAGRLVNEAKQITELAKSFCKAAEKNKSLDFSIYGDGDQYDDVERIINSYGVGERVKLFHSLPPSEIIIKLAEHHVFTLMSDYEGMPVALMEAMACGLVPVCMVKEGGINEIINHGVNGFVIHDRDKGFQEKLNLLASNPEIWESLSKMAFNTISERFSTEVTNNEWADLFLINEKPVRRKMWIPISIKLEGELLFYGDKRKPSLKNRFDKTIRDYWLKIRMFIRPRTRLRTIISKWK